MISLVAYIFNERKIFRFCKMHGKDFRKYNNSREKNYNHLSFRTF